MTAENFDHVSRLRGNPTKGYTCLLGALDLISDIEIVPAQMYEWYDEEVMRLRDSPDSHDCRATFHTVATNLGKSSLKNVSFLSVSTEEQLGKVLGKALQGGRRPLMYVQESHVVGLRPHEDNRWTLHGTWGPWPTNKDESLGVPEVFDVLYPASRYVSHGKSYKAANMIVFPPEPKH